jgi:translation initiation factor 2B subunit (eIF-2B alpha/beta/delta family)
LAFKLTSDTFFSTNQVCIATLNALSTFLQDFKPNPDDILSRELPDEWTHIVHFIKDAYPFSAGVENAIDEVWQQVSHLLLTKELTMDKIKLVIREFIETYI